MAKPTELRTFILLETQQLEFVRALQRLAQRLSGKKRQPPLHSIIQGVLMDYKRMLETSASANFLEAYVYVRSKKRAPKKPRAKGVFAGERSVIESI